MPFKDIKGQEKAVSMLREMLRNSRLSGGLLLAGPEGVGKSMAAMSLAKAVNCDTGIDDACRICPSCVKIDKGNHPDIHIIRPEGLSPIKIEEIRLLQREIFLKPFEAKVKVFIIDNAHKLTAEASNSLLKILEEPPGKSLIILISSNPAALFKTVISRCKIIRFSAMQPSLVQAVLEKEHNLESGHAHFLAYFCEGRLGSALRLKDTDIFEEKENVISSFVLGNKQSADSIAIQKREDLKSALNILNSWFRDIYLIKTGVAHIHLVNYDHKQDLLRLMNKYTFLDLEEIFQSISDSMLYLEQNINIKLLISNLRVALWKN